MIKRLFCTQKGNLLISFFIAFVSVVLFAVYKFSNVSFTDIMWNCELRKVTGLHCIGCGGTRCIQALLSGDVLSAFYYNPVVLILILALLILYMIFTFNAIKKEYKPLKLNIPNYVWILFALSLVIFLVVRNLPFYRLVLY